ncbi:hydroxysqualene dehydroxylase HpnE [Magnetospira thiophila]
MTIHIIGAGLAGLSCAVRLARIGRRVAVWESAGQAGGRCRSYQDALLDRQIDNGNHLLLSGNDEAYEYLLTLGAVDQLDGPPTASFPFLDLETGERWCLEPGPGRIPWWLLDKTRRVPGTRPWSYLRGLRLAFAGPSVSVADCLGRGTILYRRLWEPLAVAALNASGEEAAAKPLWPVLRETFGRGEAACRPRMARQGLGQAFVDPAISFLRKCDIEVEFGHRCKAIGRDGERLTSLDLGHLHLDLGPEDAVVLAVPASQVTELMEDIIAPIGYRSILNAHFKLEEALDESRIIGLLGGLSQWLFVRGDVASVTVSAADAWMETEAEVLAARLWPEVCRALDLPESPLPRHRIVKEKRATFAQTVDNMTRRPATATAWRNLFLAGDWTDTGLPATIEGAIRSGRLAAEAVQRFFHHS